jgi:MFS family permease
VVIPASAPSGGNRTPSARIDLLRAALRRVLTGDHLHNFRLLFATRLIGQLADGAFQVALASYVIFSPEKQATAGQVAQAFAVLLLPFTLVGPFAGVFLDRWPRRQVLVWANLLRAVLVVVVAVLVGLHVPNALFYIAALAVLSANRFILAGLSASLPHTVRAEQLVTANAVLPTAGTLAATAGGAVGLIAHALAGTGTGSTIAELGAVSGLYVVAALFALGIGRRALGPMEAPEGGAWSAVRTVARGVSEGARHVAARPVAGRALAAVTVARFCYAVVTIMTLLLYRNLFNSPSQPDRGLAGFALAVGLSGVGFGLGAVATPLATRRLRLEVWITLCLFGAAVTELLFGLPFRPLPLLAGALLLGVASQSQKICTDTLVQRSVDDEFRGRVFVFYDMVYNGAFVLAAAFAAAGLPPTGKSYTVLVVVAACYAVTGLWYGLKSLRGDGDDLSVPPPRSDTPAAPPTTPAVR